MFCSLGICQQILRNRTTWVFANCQNNVVLGITATYQDELPNLSLKRRNTILVFPYLFDFFQFIGEFAFAVFLNPGHEQIMRDVVLLCNGFK
jgi:hypothetical protein